MADNKTPVKPTAPTAPTTPKTEAPKTEAPKTEAPKTEAPKTEAPKTAETSKKKPVQQIVWPTAEAAKEEAAKRTYGPRKAFTAKIGTTTVHCVAYNSEYAAYEAFMAAGGSIEELGGTTRARKISADAVLAAAQTMSPEQLKALQEQLAKLTAK